MRRRRWGDHGFRHAGRQILQIHRNGANIRVAHLSGGIDDDFGHQLAGVAPAVAAAPALAPIAPPAPPSDPAPQQTKSIAVGQTKNDVLATWGQPAKDIKLSNKEIFVYPDMKVTFVGGKVSDVQ